MVNWDYFSSSTAADENFSVKNYNKRRENVALDCRHYVGNNATSNKNEINNGGASFLL